MNHIEFFKSLKNNDIKNVYLFHGEEEYIKQEALNTLISVAVTDLQDMNVSKFVNAPCDEVIAAASMIPFMSERRVIVCSSFYKEAEAKRMAAFLDNVPAETVLVFYAKGMADGKLTTVKKLKSMGCDVEFSMLSENDIAKWIVRAAVKSGVTCEMPTALFFVSMVGRDMISVKNELQKVVDYVGAGKTITKQDVSAIVTKNIEYERYAMFAYFMNGKFPDGFRALESLLIGKSADESIGTAGYFASCFKNMLIAFDGMKANLSTAEIAKQLGVREFMVKDISRNAKKFTRIQLLEAIKRFSEVIQIRISGGNGVDALKDAIIAVFVKK